MAEVAPHTEPAKVEEVTQAPPAEVSQFIVPIRIPSEFTYPKKLGRGETSNRETTLPR